MSRNSKPAATTLSRNLRKAMTREEKHLWYDFLRKLPVHVNRQKPIDNYIVDFYVACAKLVIELDGSQHFSESGKASDRERDSYLESSGNLVLRYSNYEINTNFDGVCLDITRQIESRTGFTLLP